MFPSSGCSCPGQKQEKKSRVSDIPTGPAGRCLFRLIQGGRRSVLEVTSIIVIVSIRSLTPPRQSLDTCRGHSSKVMKVSNDRVSASEVAQGQILCGNEGRRRAGEVAFLSGAKCSECP